MRFKVITDLLKRRWGTWSLLAAVVVGVAALGGTTLGLRWTNTENFCISCHEMRDNVYTEYKGTIHDSSRTGVRAICSDCHVPKTLIPLLIRKFNATFELWGKITGIIDTREKFQARRYQMAMKVWREMKENDSLECRNCHTHEGMKLEKQRKRARKFHREAPENNETCIDCHQGIAHKLPDGWEEGYEKMAGE